MASLLCPKCGTSERHADGRCKLCRCRKSSAWRRANKETVNAANRNWRHNNPDKIKAGLVRWAKANPKIKQVINARWVKANPDKVRVKALRYYLANISKYMTNYHNRRALKAGNGGTHTNKQWLELLASYYGLCAYCLNPATTRDHVVPLSKGGNNDISNIIPACRRCNISKHDNSLLAWICNKSVLAEVEFNSTNLLRRT